MNFEKAISHLKDVDSEFATILNKTGPINLPPPRANFESLIDSIVSQQLSVKAASTIFQRVSLILENDMTPPKVLSIPSEELRSAGLSGQKTTYLYALAEAFSRKPEVYNQLHELPDEEVINTLTEIKGIGVWTAQMFLMFTLLREDVFPIGDLGIRRGMENLIFEGEKQSHEKLIQRAEIWSPYRSIASLYLWKAQD
ncbi:DNA-3-methyladenine glycosylase 2 family protein [Cryomorphaceae bacterium 1068]|nr:DNA-3-methyladenine glycosylase 2 family protein [Cryomorphaceae bacterium 1068]